MLRAWSIAMEKRTVRVALLLFGILATIAFGPVSAFGAYVLLVGMTTQARDNFHLIGWGVIGIGGVIGIAGAWARLLVSGTHLQTKPLLKWVTAASLAVGLLVTAFTFTGVFLLGATISEVRADSTIDRGGPQAARPSL